MAEPREHPPHYMGRHVRLQGDLGKLARESPEGFLEDYRRTYGSAGRSEHQEQRHHLRKSFDSVYDGETLEDIANSVKNHYGNDFEDHLVHTLYHLPEDLGMEQSRKVAKNLALHLAEVTGGPEMRKHYENAPGYALDKFIRSELGDEVSQVISQSIGKQIMIGSLDDLAGIIYQERNNLKAALGGTLQNEKQSSILSRMLDAYSELNTGIAQTRENFDKVARKFLRENEDNYRLGKERLREIANEINPGLRVKEHIPHQQVLNYLRNPEELGNYDPKKKEGVGEVGEPPEGFEWNDKVVEDMPPSRENAQRRAA